MSRVRELAELIARPKDGRTCCVCKGTGVSKVQGRAGTHVGTCAYCGGRGSLNGEYKAMELIQIVEPAAIELAELILGEAK